MSPEESFSVDVQALAIRLAESRTRHRMITFAVRSFVVNVVLAYFVFVLLPALLNGTLREAVTLSRGTFMMHLVLPIGWAVIFTSVSLIRRYRSRHVPASDIARQIEREWIRLTGRHWARRTLLFGLVIGGAIGLCVGGLYAMISPVAELPAFSRLLAMMVFLGGTFVWSVPVAFLLRWMILRGYRRLQPPPQTS